MPRWINADDLPGLLQPGMTVYAPGLAGESAVFVDALKAAPDAAAGVTFVGVWLPGYNRFDYASLHEDARAITVFVSPHLHDSFAAGRLRYRPLSYFETYRWLAGAEEIDLALLHVAPPDPDGAVSLGVAWDFTPAVMKRAKLRVAHVNPALPRTRGVARLHWDDLDCVVDTEGPVAGTSDRVEPAFAAIGRHLAPLIADGATLEVGVGRVQGVLDALRDHRDLAFHSGAITPPVQRLAEAGAIRGDRNAITAGIAWGDGGFYRFCGADPRVRFAPVGWTHDIGRLREIPTFIAINAVIEVDLLGQANAEMIDGRQVSSAGGITDFMRGARLSAGGFSVVALPASARGGAVSRIVPALPQGTAVSVARADMEIVVTEHGVADLRGLDVDARAKALIAVAAPPFRDDLARSWTERRRRM